jgi:hypothetical protein
MIRTVAVVSNILKPFKPASLPISMGLRQGFWVKWLFYCLRAAVPLTIAKHLHGWRGRKHRAAHHPVDNPRELCARYLRRQRDMVRQDLYRMNRILMGKLVHTHGLGGEASHPWGNYCLKGIDYGTSNYWWVYGWRYWVRHYFVNGLCRIRNN